MNIYLDSSALVKLVIAESESPALIKFLDSCGAHHFVTSALSRTEVTLAAATAGTEAQAQVRDQLASVDFIAVDDDVLLRATQLFPRERLRTLDAIHIASAQVVGLSLESIVTYDQRMTDSARRLGFAVVQPA